MTNKQVANKFKLLGDLMELLKENPFKYRSYHNAYRVIRAQPEPVIEQSLEELERVKGIGKAIADKIHQLRDTGTITTLDRMLEQTPPGIVKLLGVKGIGVKKIATVWQELDVKSPGELLYACQENRLVELKGFGAKTQDKLRDQLEYYLATEDSMLYAIAEEAAVNCMNLLMQSETIVSVHFVGDLLRQNPIVAEIELAIITDDVRDAAEEIAELGFESDGDISSHPEIGDFVFHLISDEDELEVLCELPPDHQVLTAYSSSDLVGIPYHMQELTTIEYLKANPSALDQVITNEEIKGCIHNHTTDSDGSHSLEQMVDQATINGYEYLVISDHSRSAFYANGLKEERLLAQGKSIDQINANQSDIKVYKSVESDILNDGSLDYDQEILDQLDLVIASVHSNLGMDELKATQRLITAIEHPATRILGHPTGRLLLARKGYPIDYAKVIDACQANGVVIELNANPHRLDIDWTWLNYCIKKKVMISINPDAHHRETYTHMRYGVLAAQKAAFPRELVLNAKSLEEFEKWRSNR